MHINNLLGATTSFVNNTQNGIYVLGSGVLTIDGQAQDGARSGQRRRERNVSSGVHIFDTPGRGPSSLDGLVAWNNGDVGLRIYGGNKVKVRNGIYLQNVTKGVFVSHYANTAIGNDLSQIDLGTAGDPGGNVLQALPGSNPNGTGLCVSMSSGMARSR